MKIACATPIKNMSGEIGSAFSCKGFIELYIYIIAQSSSKVNEILNEQTLKIVNK